MNDLRRSALERFRTLGFPTSRDEEWRFTSVASVAEGRFLLARDGVASLRPADIAPVRLPTETAATLVFVNGRYAAGASELRALPPGVRVESLRAPSELARLLHSHLGQIAASDRHPFVALNTAFLLDGACISVPDSVAIPAPIHLIFVTVPEGGPVMAHPRVLLIAGRESQTRLVESYVGPPGAAYFTNTVTEVFADVAAHVDHYRIQEEGSSSAHIGALFVRAGRDTTVTCHSVSLGGALVRNDVVAVLDGEGSTCTLNGLYLADGRALVDNHTTIDHARPHCDSREIYKGILAGRGRAVFNGKIIVRPDAQKTDAKQTNRALLLSEAAQIHTKPQLEIFANDVRCTHGAAVGQMDDEAVFYLRARGLDESQARELLIRAFAGDVLNRMSIEPLGARLVETLSARVHGGAA